MKTEKVIAELKDLYIKDRKLAEEAAKALGFKIVKRAKADVNTEEKRVVSELKELYRKDSDLAVRAAKVLGYKIEAKKWESLPKGWSMESVKKFWKSLTGDRKHKIGQCIKKMTGKMDNPGAFCGSLAKKVEYSPKLKPGKKGPWWLERKSKEAAKVLERKTSSEHETAQSLFDEYVKTSRANRDKLYSSGIFALWAKKNKSRLTKKLIEEIVELLFPGRALNYQVVDKVVKVAGL